MGDRRRRSRTMQMTQYQVSLDIEDIEMINAEAELANLLMQYEYHAESNYRGGFQMRRELFDSILNAVVNHNHYFARKIDVIGRQSLSPHQKLISTFWILANGCSADSIDKYCQLAESTAIENLKRFCQAIQAIYGATYLCKPNREDLKRLLRKVDKRGFYSMIGSLDCMHWEWKNCPTAWAGQFKGRHNKPTIVLEAVASYDTWIWHAFFGIPGSNNDINVL
ncbi:uncharacterized protein [Pyrus communis]|uniref:uncharacterized protein n=1 Tax=Pyrus communis TaxID=23211 RepID=UPI0035C04616